MNFFPSAPSDEVNGQIVAVIDGVARIGQYQMVILNRGNRHGLNEGSVLSVWQDKEAVEEYGALKGKIKLPEERAVHVMVVKAYDRLSYALVMEAERDMRVRDFVRNP